MPNACCALYTRALLPVLPSHPAAPHTVPVCGPSVYRLFHSWVPASRSQFHRHLPPPLPAGAYLPVIFTATVSGSATVLPPAYASLLPLRRYLFRACLSAAFTWCVRLRRWSSAPPHCLRVECRLQHYIALTLWMPGLLPLWFVLRLPICVLRLLPLAYSCRAVWVYHATISGCHYLLDYISCLCQTCHGDFTKPYHVTPAYLPELPAFWVLIACMTPVPHRSPTCSHSAILHRTPTVRLPEQCTYTTPTELPALERLFCAAFSAASYHFWILRLDLSRTAFAPTTIPADWVDFLLPYTCYYHTLTRLCGRRCLFSVTNFLLAVPLHTSPLTILSRIWVNKKLPAGSPTCTLWFCRAAACTTRLPSACPFCAFYTCLASVLPRLAALVPHRHQLGLLAILYTYLPAVLHLDFRLLPACWALPLPPATPYSATTLRSLTCLPARLPPIQLHYAPLFMDHSL